MIGVHHRVIQADGKEDQLVLLVFLLQRRFNFVFHPGAGYRTRHAGNQSAIALAIPAAREFVLQSQKVFKF